MRKKIVYLSTIIVIVLISAVWIYYYTFFNSTSDNKKNIPPIVDLGENRTIYANCSVCFDPKVHDPDGIINRAFFEWDFDEDGIFEENSTTKLSPSPHSWVYDYNKTHVFDKPQVVNITLRVTDEHSVSAEDSCMVIVISENISFKILSDKTEYTSDEPILITTSLHNNGPLSINFSEMGLYIYTLRIFIETPEGYLLSILMMAGLAGSIYTEPYDFYNYTFDLTDPQWCFETPNHNIIGYEFNTLGLYTVDIYYNPYSGSGEVWVENTTTETLQFWIV